MGDLDMVDIAKIVFFILACAFLFSLTAFLFRDQITSRRRWCRAANASALALLRQLLV